MYRNNSILHLRNLNLGQVKLLCCRLTTQDRLVISNERLCPVRSYTVYRLSARPDLDLVLVEEDFDHCH